MSRRRWAFQQGVLWAMELAGAPLPSPSVAGAAVPMVPDVAKFPGAAAPAEDVTAARTSPPSPGTSATAAASLTGGDGPAVRGETAHGTASPQLVAPDLPRRVTGGAVQGTPRPLRANFAEVGPEALDELARAMDLREPAEVGRRFQHGRRCFVGRVDGAIATYGWLSLDDEAVGELERDYRLLAGEAYIWDCATLPAFRGAGLYSALLCHIVAALSAEGHRRAWIGANLENEPSLRAFARAGFRPIVRVAYVRLLRLRCLWLRAQPGAPAALVACARAMLTEPYERAWQTLIIGMQPREPA